ncbi:hypothetical protein ABT185_10675 [Streptomyces clavifer]|uniref:hypothetical protein n=1 Tax=Streptomyces clavifer TaxID=68188 RepID=UPI00331DE340
MKAFEDVLVGYGPPTVQDVTVHEDGHLESVVTRPVRAFEKLPGGSLRELHGEEKDAALEAFWTSIDDIDRDEETF